MQTEQQVESYKSTISHELRTPILSIILLISQIIEAIYDKNPSKSNLKMAGKNAKLIKM